MSRFEDYLLNTIDAGDEEALALVQKDAIQNPDMYVQGDGLYLKYVNSVLALVKNSGLPLGAAVDTIVTETNTNLSKNKQEDILWN